MLRAMRASSILFHISRLMGSQVYAYPEAATEGGCRGGGDCPPNIPVGGPHPPIK